MSDDLVQKWLANCTGAAAVMLLELAAALYHDCLLLSFISRSDSSCLGTACLN